MSTLSFNTDGGSRGNPGAAASAVYFPPTNYGLGRYIGPHKTNNEAEAEALIIGLEHALENGYERVSVCCDSKLVVMQSLRKWSVKSSNMAPLMSKIWGLLLLLDGYTIKHIPREQNNEADALVNQVLDGVAEGRISTCEILKLTL